MLETTIALAVLLQIHSELKEVPLETEGINATSQGPCPHPARGLLGHPAAAQPKP